MDQRRPREVVAARIDAVAPECDDGVRAEPLDESGDGGCDRGCVAARKRAVREVEEEGRLGAEHAARLFELTRPDRGGSRPPAGSGRP